MALTIIQWSILTGVQVGQQVLGLQTTHVTCAFCGRSEESRKVNETHKISWNNYLNVPIRLC